MNKQTLDVLLSLNNKKFVNQRVLAEECDISLGSVNQAVKKLNSEGLINDKMALTQKGRALLNSNRPRNAIILAAGFGMRMVPINMYTPKPLLKVNGECLIERLIRQLHEAGVFDVTVVVGFMKDSFEYLMDEYGVKLVYNRDYMHKHNLSSLSLVIDEVSNTYIMPADIWCRNNPFNSEEMYSWYMVADVTYASSNVRVNRKMELVKVPQGGNALVGICYLTEEKAIVFREKTRTLSGIKSYDDKFWEEALFENDRMTVNARVISFSDYVEINSYEQLREFDADLNRITEDALTVISEVLRCSISDIRDIEMLKKGVTNRSFVFTVNGSKYIMRIPGEEANQLIDRKNEKLVYSVINGKGICDDPIYLNPENGYRITRYIENAHCCDKDNAEDVRRCMEKLRKFHDMKLEAPHIIDMFQQIEFYESLWKGNESIYRDYADTKRHIFELKEFIDEHKNPYQLIHMDNVHDNFLFDPNTDGDLSLQMIDWEMSGMQDKDVDIAEFAIDALYDKQQTDELIDIYYEGKCDEVTRTKIYCYMSVCGLILSNWCEYKRNSGVEFGEYSFRQYRYAKEYYRYAAEMIKRLFNEFK